MRGKVNRLMDDYIFSIHRLFEINMLKRMFCNTKMSNSGYGSSVDNEYLWERFENENQVR